MVDSLFFSIMIMVAANGGLTVFAQKQDPLLEVDEGTPSALLQRPAEKPESLRPNARIHHPHPRPGLNLDQMRIRPDLR
jgi:hypothetical protein